MSNSIFILKPIIDALYEDAKRDREVMEALKSKISMLEKENSELYAENRRLESKVDGMVEIDDAAYAAEASAPATCFTGATCTSHTEEKAENTVIEPVEQEEQVEESLKTVKMVGTLSKKEYMKEYQRNYRKQRKDITLNL
jgi:activator of 2-hydroxyglutaryl-CoA dehydratase